MGSRWIDWVEIKMILRIVVGGAVRREFGLCEKSLNLRSVLSCFDALMLIGNCHVCNMEPN